MKQAKGGGSKVSHLCRFVRLFIEEHDKSITPEELLTKNKVNIKPFRKVLDSFSTDNMRQGVIKSVNQFLDHVIYQDLTIEDEDTGEIVRVMDARNPFALLLTDQSITTPQRSESTKPYLQYHFVKKAQEWIIPKQTKHFRDLQHLHRFDADWIRIDSSQIDKDDPDCVYRQTDDKYFMWNPIDWIHTYTLTKVPLRGRQIAYNDSGEADDYIADIDKQGKINRLEKESMALITMHDSEIDICLEEVSYFQQLQEVCDNATIYKSSSAENAILPRTQILDRMYLMKWLQVYS